MHQRPKPSHTPVQSSDFSSTVGIELKTNQAQITARQKKGHSRRYMIEKTWKCSKDLWAYVCTVKKMSLECKPKRLPIYTIWLWFVAMRVWRNPGQKKKASVEFVLGPVYFGFWTEQTVASISAGRSGVAPGCNGLRYAQTLFPWFTGVIYGHGSWERTWKWTSQINNKNFFRGSSRALQSCSMFSDFGSSVVKIIIRSFFLQYLAATGAIGSFFN